MDRSKEYGNILITGGAGFIGSHVCDLMIKNGYSVIIVDNLSSGDNSNINCEAKFYNMSVNSPELETVFQENKIDAVFHFAAQASVGFSTKYPLQDAQSNIIGSVNLLELCRKYEVKKIIAISTAAVYGIPQYLPVDEKHPVSCLSFYGLSKFTMENYIKLFGEFFGIDYIILRFANIYGERQSAQGEAGVITIFADKISKNEEVIIHGDGKQTRDFVHVSDAARACLKCIENHNIKNEIINISTNKAISINQLFEIIAQKHNYNKPPKYTEERIGDIKHSILDNKKCIEMLGFTPEVTIENGLKDL